MKHLVLAIGALESDDLPRTIRGSGLLVRYPWLCYAEPKIGQPLLRSLAADAYICIMVRIYSIHRIQGCGAMI